MGRSDAIERRSHFDLAEVYAFLGNNEKAYQFFDEVNKYQSFTWYWVIWFNYAPFFDGIRQEPRFQKILKDVEANYQEEHERLKKWLVEEGIM